MDGSLSEVLKNTTATGASASGLIRVSPYESTKHWLISASYCSQWPWWKAWEQVERIGSKGWFRPRVVLVTGAGPVGLLAALLAHQRGLETHIVDLVNEGAKPRLAADLGAQYHSEPVLDLQIEPDIVIECTGVGRVGGGDAALRAAPGAIIALTGFSQ